MKDLVLNWLDELAIQQHSPHTIESYHRDVLAFLQFCTERNYSIFQLNVSELREYMTFAVEQKQWSNSSMQRALSAIRQFMQFAEKQGASTQNKIQDFKIKREPRPLPGMLSIDDLNQLLDQAMPEEPKQMWLWIRDKAMLELLYSSGLRLSELVHLKLMDIDFHQNLVRVLGKGNKTRLVPFGSKAKTALLQWLQLRQQKVIEHDFVFVSRQFQPISDRQVQNRIKIQAQRAGLSADIHPHLLRHCFASHMLSESGDVRAVQEMLGHSNLNTTQIYTHLDFQHLAKEYDKAHPRAKK